MLEPNTKILVAIASYGTSNDRYLHRLLDEYRSMPFSVHLVVLSNIPKDLGPNIEVIVGLPDKDPWSLPFAHKKILADRVNQYDAFIYSEDDILITERNIRAFLQISPCLPADEIAGFFRFEVDPHGTIYFPEVHDTYHWEFGSVRHRGVYTLAFFTNEHAGCYMLTREQLQRAIATGKFLVAPHQEKYGLLETAATDPYTQCGYRKLICLSHLEDFLVHHLSNKYLARMGTAASEVCRLIKILLSLEGNTRGPSALFPTQSKLTSARYSKSYYEPVLQEVISAIPSTTRTLLSIGCGWGATEAYLADKGIQVTAIPLDPVIPGAARAKNVRLIEGDLDTARAQIASERFDCLLLSNVLHLVPQPVDILKAFRDLLPDRGSVVAVLPNLMKLSVIWKKYYVRNGLSHLGNYEKSGVHFTSHGVARRWFRSAGFKLDKFIDILPSRAASLSRLTLGVMNGVLATQFVASARRAQSRVALQ